MAGHTPVGFTALPPAIANIQDGKLRGLAIMAAKRNPGLPDVPTMAESGIPPGIRHRDRHRHARRHAAGVIERWHREIVRIVALPEVNAQLRKLGFDPIANTPAEFAARIKREGMKWDNVAKDANIRIN